MQPYVEWLEENPFYIKGNWDFNSQKWMAGTGRLQLVDHQRRILSHVLTPNEEGEFPYTTVLYSCTKKSGKTQIGASVGGWYADQSDDATEIFVIANDLEHGAGLIAGDVKYHAKRWNEANPMEDQIKIKQYEINYPNDTFIRAMAQSYRSSAGYRHSLTLWDEIWGIQCVTPDTEIYTADGWKHYQDVEIGEQVATWNDGSFEWQPVIRLHEKDYIGPMMRLKHRRSDMLLTPKHRVIGKFRSSGHETLHGKDWEIKFAADASDAYEGEVPVASMWNGQHVDKITIPGGVFKRRSFSRKFYKSPMELDAGDWLEFLGYYLAEGNIIYSSPSGSPASLLVSQSQEAHPTNFRRIQLCLDRLGFVYDLQYNQDKVVGFRVKDNQVASFLDQFGKSHQKYVFEPYKNLSSFLLNRFLIAFMNSDGWIAGKGYQCELASKQLIDDLMEIGLKCGYVVRYMGYRKRKPHHYGNYRISLSKGSVCYHRKNWSVESYSGKVWCPVTDNGTWLARRNGTVYWTGNTEDTRRMWDEMTPIPTVINSLRFITTYAGFISESDLLWDLYIQGVGQEEHMDGKATPVPELEDLPCWENGRLFCYWDHEPRMPWQTQEYYDEQLTNLRPAAYLRLHENRWVTTHETFIPIEWWDYAAQFYQSSSEVWSEHPHTKSPVYVGIDAGIKRDTTAIVGVAIDSKRGKVGQVFHRIWTPTGEESLDLEETLEAYLLEKYNKYNIVNISYDPTFLRQMMTKLKGKGLPCEEFDQTTTNMTRASQALYDTLKNKSFETYPDDEARTHIQNAVAQEEGRGFRIVKDKRNKKYKQSPKAFKPIDFAIALAISVYKAVSCGVIDVSKPINIESPFSDQTAWKSSPSEEEKLPWMFKS